MKKIALTFDIENPYKVTRNVDRVTKLLDELDIKSTLFITTDLLDSELHSIKRAQKANHEIASHGSFHPYVYVEERKDIIKENFSEKNIQEYVFKSYTKFKEVDIEPSGIRTVGFRTSPFFFNAAPNYFKYDSSQIGGKIGFKGNLLEIPISQLFQGIRFHPSFLLYLPNKFLLRRLRKIDSPIILYFHSYDLIEKPRDLKIYTSFWKKNIYYKKTGSHLHNKIRDLICSLMEEGYHFTTCMELYNSFTEDRNCKRNIYK